jgi:hypothetical protein
MTFAVTEYNRNSVASKALPLAPNTSPPTSPLPLAAPISPSAEPSLPSTVAERLKGKIFPFDLKIELTEQELKDLRIVLDAGGYRFVPMFLVILLTESAAVLIIMMKHYSYADLTLPMKRLFIPSR